MLPSSQTDRGHGALCFSPCRRTDCHWAQPTIFYLSPLEYKLSRNRSFLKFKSLYSLFILCMCTYSACQACHVIHVEVRRVTYLLPPCGAHGSNSFHQAWVQVPLPTEHLTGPRVHNFLICSLSAWACSRAWILLEVQEISLSVWKNKHQLLEILVW